VQILGFCAHKLIVAVAAPAANELPMSPHAPNSHSALFWGGTKVASHAKIDSLALEISVSRP
jgi:hypothetical protein